MRREVRAEGPVQPGSPREREGFHGRAVIGLRRRDHLPSVVLASLDVIRARELDGHLDGVRAGDREPHPAEPLGGNRDQLVGQTLLERVGEPFVVHEREPLGLGAGSPDDVAPAVPERRRHRAAAHRVQVPTSSCVLDPDALATHDDRHRSPQLEWKHVRSVALDGRFHDTALLHTNRDGPHVPPPRSVGQRPVADQRAVKVYPARRGPSAGRREPDP